VVYVEVYHERILVRDRL